MQYPRGRQWRRRAILRVAKNSEKWTSLLACEQSCLRHAISRIRCASWLAAMIRASVEIVVLHYVGGIQGLRNELVPRETTVA